VIRAAGVKRAIALLTLGRLVLGCVCVCVCVIAAVICALLIAVRTVMNRLAVRAGLAQLNAGGDFADSVMAYEGKWLGARLRRIR